MRALLCACALMGLLVAATPAHCEEKALRLGVSIAVGGAARWEKESAYMRERARELGATVTVIMNTNREQSQRDDCLKLIDSGVNALIIMPRHTRELGDVLAYARQKGVPVISYVGLIMGDNIDLFVGYDCDRIGLRMGQYLSEMVHKGNYVILRGDPKDISAKQLYEGAMRHIGPLGEDINILLDADVPRWSGETAKQMLRDVLAKNNNRVDAILAPNDRIAGACAEVLAELGITRPVVITGMDAELNAARRIVAGTQGCTVNMDLRILARTAVEEAVHLAKKEKPHVNADLDNDSGALIPANLIAGQLVIRANLDKVLIGGGFFTAEDIYGKP